ncbi:MAG: response regulator transcription factor [Chitinophagaceae bacterium]|nr:response regulator transcription factor [Bacteroidota bacterium]MCC6257941.1 response regulator transcription factor [Chitinophagaceae bacterium]MCW5917097.1 response regulator transcription factor [Ferruginibacter sp.]
MSPIHIAIAEDNPMALKSIKKKLAGSPEIFIEFYASNGSDVVELLDGSRVELVLMDIEMPVMDGITATKEIHTRFPQVKVIMLTTFDDDEKIFNAILAGAAGYLLKDESGESILNFINETIKGGAAMSAGVALKAIQYIKANMKKENGTAEDNLLSARETEILTEIKNGLSYKEIGYKLFISEGTVRKHIEHIYQKLQVNNKVSAINVAKEKRWLP